MKETTGELNGTLIVVLAVGVLAAFFFTTLWPMIKTQLDYTAKCSNAVCDKGMNSSGTVDCFAPNETNRTASNSFTCPYKG